MQCDEKTKPTSDLDDDDVAYLYAWLVIFLERSMVTTITLQQCQMTLVKSSVRGVDILQL